MHQLMRRWISTNSWRQRSVAICLTLGLAAHARAQTEPTPEQRLASELIRAAIRTASMTPISSDALATACLLGQEAVALDPDNPGLWRMVLKMATLGEHDELRAQAIERLSVLDPADDNIRLQRINLALDHFQTVEQRAAAYERLLDEENTGRLGPAAASRLALDLALLKQRTGDTQEFSRWLTRALELDRSNRSAAALAAGFFNANMDDPVGQAEMLVNLVMADPTDVQTQVMLAQHLLEHGAYGAASRMYLIAASGQRAQRLEVTTDFMADVAIAQWASGDAEASLLTIDRRQADIDEAYRVEQARTNRTLTMVQIGALKGPIDPTLAAVAAVIHAGRGDAQAADAARIAIEAAQKRIADLASANPPAGPAELATEHLQVAWLALWLGDDAAAVATHVAEAEKLQPLSDQARQRFEGWQALKNGDPDRAIELLSAAAKEDATAGVGLALALERAGRTQDAATRLLELNRAQPGSLIGIWASDQLARLLGRRVTLSETAAQLERLVASISRTFDRYAEESGMAVTLQAAFPNDNPGPFDPALVTVSLTNGTSMPLALDPEGPLRPQVLVISRVNSSFTLGEPPKPVIIDLDSRLRLMPRETLRHTLDLRWYGTGDLLNAIASGGGIVRLDLTSNFLLDESGGAVPGLYGQEIGAPLLRINGVRDDPQWLDKAVTALNDPNTQPDALMRTIALLTNELTLQNTVNGLGPEFAPALEKSREALPAAFGRLDGARQAWTLSVMFHPAPVPTIIDMARKSDSRLVRLALLLFQLDGADDPMLDAVRRSDDPALRALAERLSRLLVAPGTTPRPAPASAPSSAPASAPATAPATTAPSSP